MWLYMDDTTSDIDFWMVYRDHLSFYEWSYFNDVLIRVTSLSVFLWMKLFEWSIDPFYCDELFLSIAFYLQVNYVRPKCFAERNISLLFIQHTIQKESETLESL